MLTTISGNGSIGSDMDIGKKRGIVYGGVVKWPTHPAADMHGLVRAVVRARSREQVARAAEAVGIGAPPPSAWLSGIWAESRSVVEGQATEGRWGEMLACRLEKQYLSAENYSGR